MTKTSQRLTPQQIKAELAQCTGTQFYFRYTLNSKFRYTEGILHMAKICEAFWLIDAIMSYQREEIITEDQKLQEFQLWKLQVNQETDTAVLSCEDGNKNLILTQEIEFTDFPLAEFSCYLIDKVLLLTSEY